MHKRQRGPPTTSTDGGLIPGLAPTTFGALHQQQQQRTGSKERLPPFTAQAFARLCVRSQTLQVENATLRGTLERVAEQNKALEAQLQGLKHSTERRHQLHTQDSAIREAQLEDQLERQKTALSDLARTAEGFARENMLLKEELGQLRDDREDSSKAHAALQDRLSHLESTCLALGAPRGNGAVPLLGAAPGAGTSSSSGSRFLEQMSATLLVLSDQPKTVPPIEPSRAKAVAKGLPTDMRLALRELEAVKRERDGLQAKAARLSAQLEKLHADHRELQCSLAAERRAASMAATQLQGQLEAAQRKSARLASQLQEKNRLVEERDAYVKQLERALLTQKHLRPCTGRKQPGEASAAAPIGSDQAALREANGATSPAAANTPMSLTHIAAGVRHNSTMAAGVAGSTAAGTKSSGGWCSYHLDSPAGDSGGRCSSLSLRGRGSAMRQPKQQRPASSPGRLRRSPAAADSTKNRASTPPLRPLELTAILEALEQEKQRQGVQPQAQQSVWQQHEGHRQHACSPCERVHMQGRQTSAAPINLLFSLRAREGSPTASPWNPRSAYTPAALAAQEVASSPGPVAGEDLTQISPGCLASSLTFLHKNSLFQCSPLLPEAPQQPSPALAEHANGLPQPASRDEHVLAMSQGQQHSMGSSAVGLLSPGDAGPQREARYSAEGSTVAGRPGGQQATERGNCTDNPCGQPKAKRSLIPQWGGLDKQAALPDAFGGGHAGQLPPRQLPMASSQQAPRHTQQSSAGSPSAKHAGDAATSRASSQAARCSRPSSLVQPGVSRGSEELQRLGLEELQELPDQGFLCVADLLEALTPRAGGLRNVSEADKGGVCEQKQEQQQRHALHDREEGKEQHSSNMCMAAKGLPPSRQADRQPPSVLTNRHTQHRVGVSPAGVARLQSLKQGRVNRAADQLMHAAHAARRDSYAGAASYQAEVRRKQHTQLSPC